MSRNDMVKVTEQERIGAALNAHDLVALTDGLTKQDLADLMAIKSLAMWRCHIQVDKYWGEVNPEAVARGEQLPYDVYEETFNLLMYGGASCLWETLIGNGTATAGQALTFFNNAQAAIGVGDSTTAEAATQTNLQAASNKLRKAMDASQPAHTDGTTSGAASITFKSTFGTGDANFAWQEWGVFNSATDGTGRMLNRKVSSLGTKTSAASWVFTVTLTLA